MDVVDHASPLSSDATGAVSGVGRAATVRSEPPALPSKRDKTRDRGRQTRAAILNAALELAARTGLEGLSIGLLAEALRMSKSGVFSHFGSREELQIAVLREYGDRFEAEIFRPALAASRGLPRLRAMVQAWMNRVSREVDSGCIYISGAVEFDDRPGPVRDALVAMVSAWQDALRKAIALSVAEGHLRPDANADDLLFQLQGCILAVHHDARFLRQADAVDRARRAVEGLLRRHELPDKPSAVPKPA
jgi:AcrR family transcriptional regulator